MAGSQLFLSDAALRPSTPHNVAHSPISERPHLPPPYRPPFRLPQFDCGASLSQNLMTTTPPGPNPKLLTYQDPDAGFSPDPFSHHGRRSSLQNRTPLRLPPPQGAPYSPSTPSPLLSPRTPLAPEHQPSPQSHLPPVSNFLSPLHRSPLVSPPPHTEPFPSPSPVHLLPRSELQNQPPHPFSPPHMLLEAQDNLPQVFFDDSVCFFGQDQSENQLVQARVNRAPLYQNNCYPHESLTQEHQTDQLLHGPMSDCHTPTFQGCPSVPPTQDLDRYWLRMPLQTHTPYQGGGHYQPDTQLPVHNAHHIHRQESVGSPLHVGTHLQLPPGSDCPQVGSISATGHGQSYGQHSWHQTQMQAPQLEETQGSSNNHPEYDPERSLITCSTPKLESSLLGYDPWVGSQGEWSSTDPTSPCVGGVHSPQCPPNNLPHSYSSPGVHPTLCQSPYSDSMTSPTAIAESLGADTQASGGFHQLINQDHSSPQHYPGPHLPNANLNFCQSLSPRSQHTPPPNSTVQRTHLACETVPSQMTPTSTQGSCPQPQSPGLVSRMEWATGARWAGGPAEKKMSRGRRKGPVNGFPSPPVSLIQMKPPDYQDPNGTSAGLRLTCSVCQRDFKSLPALNGHMRSHGGFRGHSPSGLPVQGQRKIEVGPLFSPSSMVMPVSVPVSSSVLQCLSTSQEACGGGRGGVEEGWGKKRKRNLLPLPLQLPSPVTPGPSLFYSLIRGSYLNGVTGGDSVVAGGNGEVTEEEGPAVARGDGTVIDDKDDHVVASDDRVVVTGNKKLFYTPPPMLCPVRKGRGLYCSLDTSGSHQVQAVRLINTNSNVDDNEPRVPKHGSHQPIEFKPLINIGPRFQAEIPPLRPRGHAHSDSHNATLLWAPWDDLENPATQQRVKHLMSMASCNVLPGGGASSEYALHVLSECGGDFMLTVERLLFQPDRDTEGSYHYTGGVRWTPAERRQVVKAFQLHHKDFHLVHKTVQTKTLAQCVEFYYTWKKRLCLNMRISLGPSIALPEENGQTTLSSPLPSSTVAHQLQYQPDPDHCSPSCPVVSEAHGCTPTAQGPEDIRTPSWRPSPGLTSLNSPPPLLSPGPLPPAHCYPCKECHKVFSKVKSRNAHMKSHHKSFA